MSSVILRPVWALLVAFFLAISAQAQSINDGTPPQSAVTGPKVTGLTISPGDITIPSTQRAVIVTAKSEAEKKVRWIIISNTKASYLEIPQTKQVVIFPNAGPDTILVYAYTATKDGEPTEPALMVISVQGAKPPPPDPDKPPPPDPDKPVASKLVVTFIVDNDSPDIAKTSKIIDSEELVSGLKARGHARFVRDITSPRLDALKLRKYVDVIAGGPPIVVIQLFNPGQPNNGQVLHAIRVPATAPEILRLVDSLTRTKSEEN